jgi:hypothetical protein
MKLRFAIGDLRAQKCAEAAREAEGMKLCVPMAKLFERRSNAIAVKDATEPVAAGKTPVEHRRFRFAQH